jgi:hypothetical protein
LTLLDARDRGLLPVLQNAQVLDRQFGGRLPFPIEDAGHETHLLLRSGADDHHARAHYRQSNGCPHGNLLIHVPVRDQSRPAGSTTAHLIL